MTSALFAAYLAQALMLGWLLHRISGSRRAWPGAALLACVPIEGIPLAAHLNGFFGAPSISALQLLLLALLGRPPATLSRGWRAPLCIGLAGLLFYVLALGGAIKLGLPDPYRFGFQPAALLGALALPAFILCWRGQTLWLWLLSIDLAVFAFDLHASRNFWDVLIDPQLVIVCLILAYRNRPRLGQTNAPLPASPST